jgi:hypothetical protein
MADGMGGSHVRLIVRPTHGERDDMLHIPSLLEDWQAADVAALIVRLKDLHALESGQTTPHDACP